MSKIEVFGGSFYKRGKVLKIAEEIAKILRIKERVNIYLVSEQEIKELNTKYRKKPKPTNVLSFPSDSNFLYPEKEKVLGEIFLSWQFAKKEAKEFKVAFEEWLTKLLIHSFLHLLGFTHNSDRNYRIMSKKEKEIFKKIKSKS